MVGGDDTGRRIVIGSRGLTIGRTEPADIILGEMAVSRLHCRADLDGEGVVITDLESTNGSFVDRLRIAAPALLPVGGILQIGHQLFKHERLTGKQLQQSDAMQRDIAAASAYVLALLPPTLDDVRVAADWIYQPCAKLGGDVFGYGYLSERLCTAYLVDVSGHGAGAAMHGVAVMNLLRQRALPDTDFADPGAVLERLNALFQMDAHADMYFTIWYGVYDIETRELRFASAGHHPAYLVATDRQATLPMGTPSPIIGALPGRRYATQSIGVPPGALVYLFSDVVFEFVSSDGVAWRLADFLSVILRPGSDDQSEPVRLYRTMRAATRDDGFDDDFSLVVLTFK